MHKLLVRQLKRHFGPIDSVPEEWRPLLEAIDAAYHEFDTDRSLLERSMELVSQELLERNQRLREDIIERQRAEEALRESEAKYHTVVAKSAEGIYLADAHTRRILETNTAYQNMLGYTSEELLGLTIYDVVAHDRGSIDSVLQRTLQNKHYLVGERQHRRKDGSLVDVEVTINLISHGGRDILCTVVHDITERKRIENTLRESEASFRLMFAGNPLPMWVYDAATLQFLEVNAAAIEHYGYSREEFLGMRITDIRPGEDVPGSLADLGKQRVELEHSKQSRHRLKNGQIIDVEVNSHTLLFAGRDAALVVIRDITVQKKIEEERRAKEAAEAANHAKSEFLSRMSHELRTPLNSILGFAQLLRMDSTTPEQQESVEYIIKGGRHLLGLINEVLDITRIETGSLTLSPEPVSLADLLQECLDLVRPMAAGRKLALQVGGSLRSRGLGTGDHGYPLAGVGPRADADPRPPIPDPWYVMADRQRLKQVLLNLLGNAIKYNREGGRVTLACENPIESRIRIWISDTGPGIVPEKLKLLFVPFERLGAEQSGVEGTGLGLAVSKHLIEAMGGSIGVESTVGLGSAFWVELPMAEDQVEDFERSRTGPLSLAQIPIRNHNILYVEDNLSNLKLIERILAHRPDIQLTQAQQGGLGIELAREHHPDLVLLDLSLPDMPGDEVLRRLQEHPDTKDIPVVVISADATPGQIEQLLAAGARNYLTKPLNLVQFAHVLEENLNGSLGASRSAATTSPLRRPKPKIALC